MGSIVQISVSPWLLSVARLSGRTVTARHTAPLNPAEWDDACVKSFRPLDGVLGQALRVLNVPAGTRVHVEYATKDAVVDLLSYPSGGEAARDAALLALNDRLPGGCDGQPTAACLVGRDTTEPRKTHVLACADKDLNASVIASWITRAGLRLGRLRPAPSLAMAECARLILQSDDAAPLAAIYLGGSFTCIAAGRGGSLSFVRIMNFGVDLLSDAYLRELGNAGAENIVDVNMRRQARESVWKYGIPTRNEMTPATAGVSAALPLIVPVVQKFLVEIKQTIRFGFGEAELGRAKIIATGPGAAIPHLCKALSDGLDIPIETAPGWQDKGEHTLDHAELSITHPDLLIDLAPAAEVHARTSRRLNHSILIGAALGLIAVGVDAGTTLISLRRVQEQNSHSQASVSVSREHFQNRERAAQLATVFREQYSALSDAMNTSPDWTAVLVELGRLTDKGVRLTQLDADSSSGRSKLEITGLAFTDMGGDSLRDFMNKLMHSPLAQAVELGPTRNTEAEGRPAIHFTLSATMRALPAAPGAVGKVASAAQEDHR